MTNDILMSKNKKGKLTRKIMTKKHIKYAQCHQDSADWNNQLPCLHHSDGKKEQKCSAQY